MKILNPLILTVLALADTLAGTSGAQSPARSPDHIGSRVQMVIEGGHETYPRDHGRPVALIAAALKVTPEVFRDAFSQVKPAPAGEAPDPGQVQRNKMNLLQALEPHGVTKDRLDEVSNFYRYNDRGGGLWRHTPAIVQATVRAGVVTGFTILNPGAGYTSAPRLTIPGLSDLKITVTLAFGPDFIKNGSIKDIKIES